MKALVFLCVLALVFTTSAKQFMPFAEIQGKNCNTTLTGFTVTEFTVNPWPPVKSGDFTVNLSGTFNQAVTLTGCDAVISLDEVPFTTVNVPASGTFAAGESYSNSFSQPMPSFLPDGNYAVKTSLLYSNDKPLGCWEIDFTL